MAQQHIKNAIIQLDQNIKSKRGKSIWNCYCIKVYSDGKHAYSNRREYLFLNENYRQKILTEAELSDLLNFNGWEII